MQRAPLQIINDNNCIRIAELTTNQVVNLDIDIDALSIEELEALNHRIVERIKFLDDVEAHYDMMTFNIGVNVTFDSTRHGRQFGTRVKFNRKTVSVLTADGQQWKVPPHHLTEVKDATPKRRVVQTNDGDGV